MRFQTNFGQEHGATSVALGLLGVTVGLVVNRHVVAGQKNLGQAFELAKVAA